MSGDMKTNIICNIYLQALHLHEKLQNYVFAKKVVKTFMLHLLL